MNKISDTKIAIRVYSVLGLCHFGTDNQVLSSLKPHYPTLSTILNILKCFGLELICNFDQPLNNQPIMTENLEIEAMTKGQIHKKLKIFNEKTVRKEIIDVVKNLRQVSQKEARDCKRLKPSEVEEILSRFK